MEPLLEETIQGSSTVSERERSEKKAQQKMNGKKSPRIIETGILCWDKLWAHADQKSVLPPYISFGVEERQLFICKNPLYIIDELDAIEFWNLIPEAIIGPRKNTLDKRIFHNI